MEGLESAPHRPVGFIHLVGGQAGKVGHIKFWEDALGRDLRFAFAEAVFRRLLALAGVVGVQAHDDVLRRQSVVPVRHPQHGLVGLAHEGQEHWQRLRQLLTVSSRLIQTLQLNAWVAPQVALQFFPQI